MNEIFVFIPHDMEIALIQKSVDLIHRTNKKATVVIVDSNQKSDMTDFNNFALMIVNKEILEVNKLGEQIKEFSESFQKLKKQNHELLPTLVLKNKRPKVLQRESLRRFNLVNKRNKQILLNRTRHK